MVVVVDESSTLPLLNGGAQSIEGNVRMGRNGVMSEEPCEIPTNNDIIFKIFDEERRYFMRERRPFGKWRENHILPTGRSLSAF